jgi:hypothetical protein
MTPQRRTLLKGIALFAGAGALRARWAPSGAAPRAALVVYDSRHPESHALVRPGTPAIDLQIERGQRWTQLRGYSNGGCVIGATTWNDLVQVRCALDPKGFRLRSAERQGRLYRWEIESATV